MAITHVSRQHTEEGAKLSLTKEEEEILKVVYKKAEDGKAYFAGFWNPEADYPDGHIAVPERPCFGKPGTDGKSGQESQRMEDFIYRDQSPGYVMSTGDGYAGALAGITFGAGTPFSETFTPHVFYQAHTQNIGWMNDVPGGQTAGTAGKSLRLEALRIRLENAPELSGVEYHVFADGMGWLPWVTDNETSGTVGESRRIEAVQIRLLRVSDYLSGAYTGKRLAGLGVRRANRRASR